MVRRQEGRSRDTKSENHVLNIVKHSENAFFEQAHRGEWVDLAVCEEVVLKQGDFTLLNLGVSIELPNPFVSRHIDYDYEALLVPRSSTFKNYGILQTNSIGVIDNTYCGDDDVWKMPVYATRDTVIPLGARVAQFRLFKNQGAISFNVVSSLGSKNRGGFGSTGI